MKRRIRRHLVLVVWFIVLNVGIAMSLAASVDYPTRPIEVVVPTSPRKQ